MYALQASCLTSPCLTLLLDWGTTFPTHVNNTVCDCGLQLHHLAFDTRQWSCDEINSFRLCWWTALGHCSPQRRLWTVLLSIVVKTTKEELWLHYRPCIRQQEGSLFVDTIILDILCFIPSSFISARIPKTYYLPVLIHYFLNVLSIHVPTPFFSHQLSTILRSPSQTSQALHTIIRTQSE